ncbi:MAG: hypothetical protein J0L93_08615 [Deltaproteobacteria bacterium]|nr:hypothetical protein [Deltaproteobacteria bacterium]
MSVSPNTQEIASPEFEQTRRDFLNSIFALLKSLSVHDIHNVALQRPFQNFEKALNELRHYAKEDGKVEMRYQDHLFILMGHKITNHFSVVEAMKVVGDAVEIAMIESLTFHKDLKREVIGEFFAKWALHNSVHQRPKELQAKIAGIDLVLMDPSKANLRLKTKQLLLSPQYALQHYFLLRKHTENYFEGITSQKLNSQKNLRRELMEMVEIARVAPYQLISLSLIREDPAKETSESAAVSQAIATCMLCIVLAKELNFSVREQVNLGLVGLLYNVGLLGNEAAAVLKNEKLTPVEYKRVLDAQTSGVYKLIRLQGSSRPVLERLLAIFEQSRGSDVKSVSLTLESRLVRLVSQYVALISDRPFRDAYTPSEAVKILGNKAVGPQARDNSGDLDPIIYYVFVRLMGVYPVGSLCLLSNGKKAIVFRPSGDKLGEPMIKVLPATEAERAELLDLAHHPDFKIVKTLDPKREGISIPGFFFD